tara:strand:- start:356 stop:601 length:246 start_codon:yes stop_codon:yes gene_type:complete
MTNLEKYKKTYTESLSLSLDYEVEDLEYNAIPEWDSIGHMTLVSAIEDEFDISMETDDIIELSSFKKGIEILTKYKVEIKI